MTELGDEVKCRVTGLKGIVVSKTQFLNGCVQVGIQAPLTKEGKVGESWNIDESQVDLVKRAKVKVTQRDIGGPMRKLHG